MGQQTNEAKEVYCIVELQLCQKKWGLTSLRNCYKNNLLTFQIKDNAEWCLYAKKDKMKQE